MLLSNEAYRLLHPRLMRRAILLRTRLDLFVEERQKDNIEVTYEFVGTPTDIDLLEVWFDTTIERMRNGEDDDKLF